MEEITGVNNIEQKIEKKKVEALENTIRLIERIFDGTTAKIILSFDGKDSELQIIGTRFDLNNKLGQKIGFLDLHNFKPENSATEIIDTITKSFIREIETFDELEALAKRELNQTMELQQYSLELNLAYEDLSLAHEELSEAYNMTVLLNRNLSRTTIRVKSFLEQAPIAFGILRHRHLKIELANSLILKLWGKDKSVIGKPLSEGLPELAGQPYLQILDDVYTKGERYIGKEARVSLKNQQETADYYFNFIYEPLKNERGITNAIMIIATDVTELINNRNTIAEANK